MTSRLKRQLNTSLLDRADNVVHPENARQLPSRSDTVEQLHSSSARLEPSTTLADFSD